MPGCARVANKQSEPPTLRQKTGTLQRPHMPPAYRLWHQAGSQFFPHKWRIPMTLCVMVHVAIWRCVSNHVGSCRLVAWSRLWYICTFPLCLGALTGYLQSQCYNQRRAIMKKGAAGLSCQAWRWTQICCSLPLSSQVGHDAILPWVPAIISDHSRIDSDRRSANFPYSEMVRTALPVFRWCEHLYSWHPSIPCVVLVLLAMNHPIFATSSSVYTTHAYIEHTSYTLHYPYIIYTCIHACIQLPMHLLIVIY